MNRDDTVAYLAELAGSAAIDGLSDEMRHQAMKAAIWMRLYDDRGSLSRLLARCNELGGESPLHMLLAAHLMLDNLRRGSRTSEYQLICAAVADIASDLGDVSWAEHGR